MGIFSRVEVIGTPNISNVLKLMGILFTLIGIFFYAISVWGLSWSLFFAIMFFIGGSCFFVSGVVILLKQFIKNKNIINVIKTGTKIKTKFFNVEMNQYLTVNYKHPYQIISTWKDKTNKIHVFKSQNIWFNPERFVPKIIYVYVDMKNPSIYYMDISFLNNILKKNN